MNRRNVRKLTLMRAHEWEEERQRMQPSGEVFYLDIIENRPAEHIKIDFTVKPWGVEHEPA